MIRLQRTAKIALWIGYVVLFSCLLLAQIYLQINGAPVSVSSIIYWLILLGWVGLILNFKWQSSASLYPAFVLFIIAAALTIVGLKNIGETIMRISFIGWLVGIGQALVEYRKEHDKKPS